MGAAQGGAVGGVGGGKVGAVLEGGETDAAAAGHCCEGFQAGGAFLRINVPPTRRHCFGEVR